MITHGTVFVLPQCIHAVIPEHFIPGKVTCARKLYQESMKEAKPYLSYKTEELS